MDKKELEIATCHRHTRMDAGIRHRESVARVLKQCAVQ